MGWHEEYRQKLCTADEAVRHIPDHARVLLGHAANEPKTLVEALVRNYQCFQDVEVVHWVTLGRGAYCTPEMKGHLRHNAMFACAATRDAIHAGRADYTPMSFYESAKNFSNGTFPIDVALVSVTPPDEHGYVSLGCSVCATRAAVLHAKLVIAQVNAKMPRTMGDSCIHISHFDRFVEAAEDLPTLEPAAIGPVEEAIGRHIAELVEDGTTLQIGFGKIPDAVLKFLGNKKRLGIHSEMISDGIIDLVESGVITGENKSIDRGKMVCAFLLGTKRLYDFVDNHPAVCVKPIEYVNNPAVICQNPKVVSINSCLQVDFNGQVNSEMVGTKQYSGVGGQLDFVRGAAMCPDGKSVLAMPSTAENGKTSRIVPAFEPGTVVTTTQADVHYIVTEYGAVNLKGKSLRERTKLLIGIAHPKFRNELMAAYERRYGMS